MADARAPRRPFLAAQWRRLVLVQYEADPGLLAARLPPGLKLDRWQGGVYVSLVAFEFLDTRVLGFSFPGCVNFPEVNLRFYVTDGERRGVCFVRELVPQRLTSWVARWRYNEPYARAAMRVRSSEESGTLTIEHRFAAGGGEHRVYAQADAACGLAEPDSLEHHFKEHEWGFGVSRRGQRLEYRVEHPVWRTHRVRACEVRIDAARLYGPAWAWMSTATPASVVVAEGSAVRVWPHSVQRAAAGD